MPVEKVFIQGDHSVIRFINHANVVSDECEVTNRHLLIDKSSGICRDEDRAAHVGRKISRECLLRYSVSLIVVNATIPYYGAAALHHRV